MSDNLALSEYEGAALYIDKQGIPWMTQRQIGEWLGLNKQAISYSIKAVLKNKAVHQVSEDYKIPVVKQDLTTAVDGKNYRVNFYNMFVIMMVALRSNQSEHALRFQVWALRILAEAMVSDLRTYIKWLEIELSDLAQRHYDAEDEAEWARLAAQKAEARAQLAEADAYYHRFIAQEEIRAALIRAELAEQEANDIRREYLEWRYGDLDNYEDD